ncbi:fungal transcription factor regulatory middle homology region [Aspergillus udagawae]|uniref:Fungal transcription factor regulatory middle homology region n=1 Tax=Aspergillus udagawae TaxID=91492 RepID=A0ABQ1AXZ3_9EURO|nr:fungal transcription factor regulatory middle homology region [Aspergillus udagawae]
MVEQASKKPPSEHGRESALDPAPRQASGDASIWHAMPAVCATPDAMTSGLRARPACRSGSTAYTNLVNLRPMSFGSMMCSGAISCRAQTITHAARGAAPLRLEQAPRARETHATSLEEPQDENASTNGMAMTFVEEQSSAFFGESSNVNFTQLLLRGIAAVHQASPAVTSAVDKDSTLRESIIASVPQGRPYHPVAASSTHLDLSPATFPSVEEMDSLLDIYFDTAGASSQDLVRDSKHDIAMASSFNRDRVASAKKPFERSNVFYKRALELCGDLSRRVISLEMVHYLLLIVIHCQVTQRSVQAWNNHGLVIRSAIALGLHSDSSGRAVDSVNEEYRRRTWVVIYCLDKVLSVAFGRPASAVAQYGANLENADSNPDDIASLKASGDLRKMLQVWAASLPSYLRLCERDSSVLSHNTPANRFRVILTLRYHNLAIPIHKQLLSATIHHPFRAKSAAGGSPPYLIQLAMAEAHECIRAAQLTIEIVHSIISADSTSKNNLGV